MEQIKMRTRQRRTNQQIVQLLEEFEKSKSTAKDFCTQHSISLCNFYKWKSRYRSNMVSKNKPSGFACVDIVASSQDPLQGLFAEVRGIKIFQPVSASFLKALL